jgi:Ni/Co efflux regulator RcnB
MRPRNVFSPGSRAVPHRRSLGRAGLNSVGLRCGRSSGLAVAALIGLLWPAAGLAQDSSPGAQGSSLVQAGPHAAPPAPSPTRSDRPKRPSYGRWSPGQVLPPSAGAVEIADYEQFHLRRPPRGYSWMQCDGDFVLINAAGLIFEVIPGGGR